MGDPIEYLFLAARAAQANAHAPYSGFKVGAAIRCEDGSIHAGCNVENAAYPVGTCAEAGAIAAMVAGGQQEIIDIVVIGSGDKPCFPCGACRQRIFEFSGPRTRVHLRANGGIESFTIGDLLPHAFGPATLA
ncbi:MAG: cytidine deaminase [Beijerinckiaceae bacterium]|nr:cytidine deaminase [Beijerinckiaceae bacterium]